MLKKIFNLILIFFICAVVIITTYYAIYFRPYQASISAQIIQTREQLNENTINKLEKIIKGNDKYLVSRNLLDKYLVKNKSMRQIYYSLHFFCWHEIVSIIYSDEETALLFVNPSSNINLFEASQLHYKKNINELTDKEIEELIDRITRPGKYRRQKSE